MNTQIIVKDKHDAEAGIKPRDYRQAVALVSAGVLGESELAGLHVDCLCDLRCVAETCGATGAAAVLTKVIDAKCNPKEDHQMANHMKLECVLADVCLPGYWSGHYRIHVQVPVYRGMKLRDLKAAIRDELRLGAVAGSSDDARLLSGDMVRPDEEKRADQLTRAAYAAVNRIRPARKGAKTLFRDLEEQPEDGYSDSVYAFFVFVEV